MKQQKISTIFRIDYPEIQHRVEDQPLGLFFMVNDTDVGLRINIDNSGEFIEYAMETPESLSQFMDTYYGALSEVSDSSLLSNLIARPITNLHIGSVISSATLGDGFINHDEDIVVLQIELSSEQVLTFFNDGDEGKFTFEYPIQPGSFQGRALSWRKVDDLIGSLFQSKVSI